MFSTHQRIKRLAGKVAPLAACALAAWTAVAQAPQTVRDGVFSQAQVERGKREFDAICMNCHELEEFTGAGAYLEEASGKTVWELFEYVWAEMPEDDPASLDPNDYAAVLAYAFNAWGLPAGAADMPIDKKSLEAIKIVAPE